MLKILIVEDNDDIREILELQLRGRDFTTVSASDGKKGLATVETERPDLILMDLNMPVITGWEATKRLKTASATRDIPIIALTAYATSEDRDKEYEAGADAFVSKPIDFGLLLEKIDALLETA